MSGNNYTTLARACQSSRAMTREKHWHLGVALNQIESRAELTKVITKVCKSLGGNREATRKMMQRAMFIAKTNKTLAQAKKEPKAKAKKATVVPIQSATTDKVAVLLAALTVRQRAGVMRTVRALDNAKPKRKK